MGRRATKGPTEAELEILSVLWDLGPGTVRQINAAMNRRRPTGKTTTLKLMQIMTEKGLLVRDESVRPQLYRPALSRKRAQSTLVHGLMARAFDGSAAQLVLRALATQKASAAELAEIRELLDKLQEKGT